MDNIAPKNTEVLLSINYNFVFMTYFKHSLSSKYNTVSYDILYFRICILVVILKFLKVLVFFFDHNDFFAARSQCLAFFNTAVNWPIKPDKVFVL